MGRTRTVSVMVSERLADSAAPCLDHPAAAIFDDHPSQRPVRKQDSEPRTLERTCRVFDEYLVLLLAAMRSRGGVDDFAANFTVAGREARWLASRSDAGATLQDIDRLGQPLWRGGLVDDECVAEPHATCDRITARVASSAANMCSTRSEASVMSCGVPKVVNMLKNASSPCTVAKRVVSTGAAGGDQPAVQLPGTQPCVQHFRKSLDPGRQGRVCGGLGSQMGEQRRPDFVEVHHVPREAFGVSQQVEHVHGRARRHARSPRHERHGEPAARRCSCAAGSSRRRAAAPASDRAPAATGTSPRSPAPVPDRPAAPHCRPGHSPPAAWPRCARRAARRVPAARPAAVHGWDWSARSRRNSCAAARRPRAGRVRAGSCAAPCGPRAGFPAASGTSAFMAELNHRTATIQ